MRPLNDAEQQVLALLQAAKASLSLKQIGQKMPAITGRELGVALDTLTLRDLVERVDTGRDVSFAALAGPSPAKTPPTASTPTTAASSVTPCEHAQEATAAPAPSTDKAVTASVCDRVLNCVARCGTASGVSSAAVAIGIGHGLEATKAAMKDARDKGLLRLEGKRAHARWFITDAGLARLGLTSSTTTTESTPGVTTPAVQPIDTATSTAAPAACQTHAAVTEPTGPRDGLSSFEDVGEFEPAADELLAWHAQRAEHEAARRRQAAGEPAAVVFGDLNELFAPPPLALPHAMRNTGESEPGELGIALTHTLVDSARFALWSDGVLEIDGGEDRMTLTAPATRALLDYLDRVCATAQH